MKILWCDTETTGLNPIESAPFQVAFIYQNINGNDSKEVEKVFYLNPLNDRIKFNEDSEKIHGVSEKTIKSFPKAADVVPEIYDFLYHIRNDFQGENTPNIDRSLPFFCGYNGKFDYEHLSKLFSDYGLDFHKLFQPIILDVFEQVKKAGSMRKLPYLENRKLSTVCRYYKIELNAHDAMSDIKATKVVSKILQKSGVSLY